MKRFLKTGVYIILGLIGVLVVTNVPPWLNYRRAVSKDVTVLKKCIERYMEEHKGLFPASEEALCDGGFLKKQRDASGMDRFFIGNGETLDEWINADVSEYKITWGIEYQQLQGRDGKLVSATGKAVLLIEGPGNLFLRPAYEQASWEIYEKMRDFKNNLPER